MTRSRVWISNSSIAPNWRLRDLCNSEFVLWSTRTTLMKSLYEGLTKESHCSGECIQCNSKLNPKWIECELEAFQRVLNVLWRRRLLSLTLGRRMCFAVERLEAHFAMLLLQKVKRLWYRFPSTPRSLRQRRSHSSMCSHSTTYCILHTT